MRIPFSTASRPVVVDLLPWEEIVAPGVLSHLDGALLAAFRFRGPDLDAATPEEIEALSKALDRILTPLGDGWMLHLDVHRLPAPGYPRRGAFPDPFTAAVDEERRERWAQGGERFESRSYLSLTHKELRAPLSPLRRLFTTGAEAHDAAERHLGAFEEEVAGLEELLRPHLRLERLSSRELLAYLYRCLTLRQQPLNLPEHPVSLELLFGAGPLLLGREIRFDDLHIVPVDLSGFPAAANAASLDFLNELTLPYRATWRFLPLSPHTAHRAIDRRRVHWTSAGLRFGTLVAHILGSLGGPKAPEPLEDRFAVEMKQDLEEAALWLERHETSAGYLTTTVLTFDTDRERALAGARQLVGELRNRGFLARIESLNAPEAYLGSLPGVGSYNVRRPLVVNRTFIDLALTTSVWAGSPTHPSPHLAGHPAHLVASSRGSTPFFFSLGQGDVQHALVVGPTGAGKSVLVNFLIHQFFRYPEAQVLAIDKGWSLSAATLAAGGAHYPLSPDPSPTRPNHTENPSLPGSLRFAPLAHLESPAEIQAAASWVEELLRLQGVVPSPEIAQQVDAALRLLAVAPNRTLGTFASKVQSLDVRRALSPYHGSGRLAHLFDGRETAWQRAPLQVFEMEDVLPLEEKAVTPLVLHLFREIERRLDGRPTLVVVEEALPYLGRTLFSERFAAWLYQLRKANAGVVFVGQSLAAFLDSPLKHALLESCPTRVYLPNPAAVQEGPAAAYRAFGLNRRQIELIAEAIPKREYFCVTPEGSRLFELDLSPAALAVYGLAGPKARSVVARFQETHGEGWLEAFLAEGGHTGFLTHLGRCRSALAPTFTEDSPCDAA